MDLRDKQVMQATRLPKKEKSDIATVPVILRRKIIRSVILSGP